MMTSEISTHHESTRLLAETHAQNTREPGQTATVIIPTCPDTSLPWPEDFALGGWSARMFLHQLLSGSNARWHTSDTERVLSDWTPARSQANPGSGRSLSAIIKSPKRLCEQSFRTDRMVRGLIRRCLERGRSLRLLLHTELATIPVIVIFGTNPLDYESWTVKSENPLPDSLVGGLLDFLRQHVPACSENL